MDKPKKQTYYQKNRERLLEKQREYNNDHMTQHLERNKNMTRRNTFVYIIIVKNNVQPLKF